VIAAWAACVSDAKICCKARESLLPADGVEKVELDKPRSVLQQKGAQVEVLSLKYGEIQARDHDLEPAGRSAVDQVVSDAS
jgi:protease I